MPFFRDCFWESRWNKGGDAICNLWMRTQREDWQCWVTLRDFMQRCRVVRKLLDPMQRRSATELQPSKIQDLIKESKLDKAGGIFFIHLFIYFLKSECRSHSELSTSNLSSWKSGRWSIDQQLNLYIITVHIIVSLCHGAVRIYLIAPLISSITPLVRVVRVTVFLRAQGINECLKETNITFEADPVQLFFSTIFNNTPDDNWKMRYALMIPNGKYCAHDFTNDSHLLPSLCKHFVSVWCFNNKNGILSNFTCKGSHGP